MLTIIVIATRRKRKFSGLCAIRAGRDNSQAASSKSFRILPKVANQITKRIGNVRLTGPNREIQYRITENLATFLDEL